MNRSTILAEAARLTAQDRNQAYGPPRLNHERIAAIWSVILEHEVTAAQVALCMVGTKLARLVETPDHLDSFIDAAAYAAIAGEIATEEEPCLAPSEGSSTKPSPMETAPSSRYSSTIAQGTLSISLDPFNS